MAVIVVISASGESGAVDVNGDAKVSLQAGADEVTIEWMADEAGTYQFQVGSPPVSLASETVSANAVTFTVLTIEAGDLDEGSNELSIVKAT